MSLLLASASNLKVMRCISQAGYRLVGLVVCSCLSLTAVARDQTSEDMLERYAVFRAEQDAGENPLPFKLGSSFKSKESKASVSYFIDRVGFEDFASLLGQPEQWCEFIPLHLNIKACGYDDVNGQQIVKFFAGVKDYVTPDDAHLLQLSFKSSRSDGVFSTDLFAADGPLDSRNIYFKLRAIEVLNGKRNGENGVYVEFELSSEPGIANGLARVYLATIARKKIGFSIRKKTWSGKTRYVGGQRGAIERNIVRYLLAIETYFDTAVESAGLSNDELYEKRIAHWYDATDRFRPQLFELPRSEYIYNKQLERQNQKILQQALADRVQPVYKQIDERR